MNSDDQSKSWEKKVLENLAISVLNEQRRTRRWSIFFKLLTFSYLLLLLFIFMGWISDSGIRLSDNHTALVDVQGVISDDSISSAENVIKGLQMAFQDNNTHGVIIRINSPGGSPVQAGIINDEIRRLKSIYSHIPVYAVISDICASGGYYVAAATDKIFVDKASLVGSIGVVMNGFGFTGTLEKLGVERRLLTAGENKGFLDPFSPLNPNERDHASQLLNEIHEQFITVVRHGRGERLKDVPEIFSGFIWTGQKSIELGLADELGSAEYVAREIIKAEEIVDFTVQEGFAQLFAKRFSEITMRILQNAHWQW